MVYRYESDEDAFLEYPEPGPAATPPPAGPSPSRFPTPSLPPARVTRPALDDARAPAPAPPAPAPTPGRPAPPGEPNPVPQPLPPVPQPVPAATPTPPPDATTRPTVPIPASPTFRATDVSELPRARHGDRRGGGRVWQTLIGGAAVLLLLSLTGLAVAALLDERAANPPASEPTAQATAPQADPPGRSDLDSRDTDQAPLTVKEVFPGKQLVITDGKPAYRVLKTQASANCAVAATGEIADLLVRLGCNQVVRGTLRSPDGDHLLTAGLFNLTDVASVQRVRDRIRPLLDDRQGRFRGMPAGDDTETVEKAAARVGWQVRGHYLAFCLVTRADGERIPTDDARAREIMYDLVELHLNRGVLDHRAAGGTAGQPTDGPTDDSAGQQGTDD
ncbi:hypothetical protein AB0H28_01555 [Micromonospora sp. NPDC050980]|uniref:hypothetical protein n=1 Tax=Micromonospora sp. NPDC050980 TaxID=3155161 RepID=UPI003400B069